VVEQLDVVQLTRDLVGVKSVSQDSNAAVADLLEDVLRRCDFEVERLEYDDAAGVRKVNLVAKKGQGGGGLGFFSHLDTVPGTGWDRDPWTPAVEGDRLIGLGACDMKGPLAATLVAANAIDAARLKAPITIAATADEEVGYGGARQVVAESALFKAVRPRLGVVAEPTRLVPVHAHKGGASVRVTAHGVAAHTSTDRGVSANFLIAPFLAEMAELAQRLKSDPSYQNPEFDPPTLGFNMVLNDGGTAGNVTAARTTATLGLRPMPNDRSGEVIAEITERARRHGLEVTSTASTPFQVSPDTEIVRAALAATGAAQSRVVPYGTEAAVYKDHLDVVILGPGDIAQAHTNGEWIELAQLHQAVDVYTRMIERLCC
jgi:acetylornithine deacetylase